MSLEKQDGSRLGQIFGSDALESYNRQESRREHSIISEPAIQVDPANARLAAHSVSG
jgi:hypothetical protein